MRHGRFFTGTLFRPGEDGDFRASSPEREAASSLQRWGSFSVEMAHFVETDLLMALQTNGQVAP